MIMPAGEWPARPMTCGVDIGCEQLGEHGVAEAVEIDVGSAAGLLFESLKQRAVVLGRRGWPSRAWRRLPLPPGKTRAPGSTLRGSPTAALSIVSAAWPYGRRRR